MTKLWLDTDIGTDCDDSVCLAYLLAQRDCALLGISTVGMASSERAAIVEVICRQFGRDDIPIVAGADRPLFETPYWTGHHLHQASVLERWPASRTYPPNRALPLMREAIEANPGEVVMLTIGPLSNLALLAAAEPELVQQLAGVWSMGGYFTDPADPPQAECNIMLDPVAAGIAFQHQLPDHRLLSLNYTRGKRLDRDQVRTCFGADAFAPVLECCDPAAGDKTKSGSGLHDPLTAAAIFHPQWFQWRRGHIGCHLYDHDLRHGHKLADDKVTGATWFKPDQAGPHQLVTDGDAQVAIDHIIKTVRPVGPR